MIRNSKIAIALALSSSAFTLPSVSYAETEASLINNQYMGSPVQLEKAENGAIANKKILDGVETYMWLKPETTQVAEGIWQFGGHGVAPMVIIDAGDGLIAFDTGDVKHDGEMYLEMIRKVTKKPIKVIIYGHSHTVAGAGVLAEGNEDVMVIGHKNLNSVVLGNVSSGGAPSFYPEVSPILTARAFTQFNAYMPREGEDAYVVPINLGAIDAAFLPVNTPVEHEQEMTVLGIKMRFLTKHGTDDRVHTGVWMPERKIMLTTMLWASPPQLYSVRGDVFRDPRDWIAGLKEVRSYAPEILISAAAKPVVGKEKIFETLQAYLDGASFVLDQSLRGILHGMGPDDLRHFVKMPPYLDDAPINLQAYGEVSSYPPAIFYQTVGWYDNDAANLKPITPLDEATRLVALMGGRDKVIEEARAALYKKEYSWAAQLVNKVYLIDKQDIEARQLKADALRQMAYVSTGQNDRAHLLSQALTLEGKVQIPRLIPPAQAFISHDPVMYVDFLRVRLDPVKSDKTDKFIQFNFDDGSTAGLHVRRAIAEFVPDSKSYYRKPDVTLSMSGETWSDLYLNKESGSDLIDSGEIKITGDKADVLHLLSLFDVYRPQKALIIPPANLTND